MFRLFKSANEDSFFDGFIFFFIGICGLLLFYNTFRNDRIRYKDTHKLISYFPTLVGVFFIISITITFLYLDRKRNSPTLISAFYDGGFNGFSVDLKENGNYVMANGSGLGQNYFYGTYTIQDSIVTLDKTNIDKVITSDKLVIRTVESHYPDLESEKYLFQIDKDGHLVDKDFSLRITNDNRR